MDTLLQVFFKKTFFFLMWAIFKVFIEFVIILFLLYVLFFFFGREACEIVAPWPGIKPFSLEPPQDHQESPHSYTLQT